MILARVAYDAYNQQFRLADPEMAAMFEDGECYLLLVDFLPKAEETASFDEVDLTALFNPPPSMGHA